MIIENKHLRTAGQISLVRLPNTNLSHQRGVPKIEIDSLLSLDVP